MEVLIPDNTSFNLNQPSSKLIDSKMCVFDYSDKNDIDFFMKKILMKNMELSHQYMEKFLMIL